MLDDCLAENAGTQPSDVPLARRRDALARLTLAEGYIRAHNFIVAMHFKDFMAATASCTKSSPATSPDRRNISCETNAYLSFSYTEQTEIRISLLFSVIFVLSSSRLRMSIRYERTPLATPSKILIDISTHLQATRVTHSLIDLSKRITCRQTDKFRITVAAVLPSVI